MKNLFLLSFFVLATLRLFADYNGTITVNPQSLSFEQKDGYDIIKLNGYNVVEQPGAPMLPAKVFTYIIPFDKKVIGINITNITEQNISGSFNIYPYQISYIQGATPLFTQPDPNIYSTNNFWPDQNIILESNRTMSATKLFSFIFYPVKYNPVTGQAQLITNITFTLVYANNDNNDVVVPKIVTQRTYDIVKSQLTDLVSNTVDVDSYYQPTVFSQTNTSKSIPSQLIPGYSGTLVDYVIITNNTLSAGFKEIADYKMQKGTTATVVTTEWISQNYPGCDLPEQIRNFIKDAYVNWGTTWILLGGDVSIVPSRYVFHGYIPFYQTVVPSNGLYIQTNLYYSCLDGNWNYDSDLSFGEGNTNRFNDGTYNPNWIDNDVVDLFPEVKIGRLPIQTLTELNNWKTKYFEYVTPGIGMNNHGSLTDKNNILLFSQDQPSGPLSSDFFNVEQELSIAGKIYDHLYQTADNATKQQVIDALNGASTNYHIICGNGHGNSTNFFAGNAYMNISDIDGLTNTDGGQILYLNHCLTSKWDENAITEHYLKNPSGGVAIIANTSYGITFYDVSDYNFGFIGGIYNQNKKTLGEALDYAKSLYTGSLLNDVYNFRRLEYFILNLSGDPEMEVWTDNPQVFITGTGSNQVTFSPSVISAQSTSVSVNINSIYISPTVTSQDFIVTLFKDGEVFASQKQVGTNGNNLSFVFNGISPQTTGNLKVTITSHNYQPFITDIPVNFSGVHVYVYGTQINEYINPPTFLGIANQKVEAGETIDLAITLKNNGISNLSSSALSLSWVQENRPDNTTQPVGLVNIITSTNNYTINAGQTDTKTYRFSVDANDVYDGELVHFVLNYNSLPYLDFYIQITKPNFIETIKNITISGSDDNLDAGETASMTIELRNTSLADVAGLTATLSEDGSSYLNITDATANYGTILTHSSVISGNGDFAFSVNTGYAGQLINMLLNLTDQHGTTWSLPFKFINPIHELPVTCESFGLKEDEIYNSNNGITYLSLYWGNPNPNILGYNIYRCDADANGNSLENYTILNSEVINSGYYQDYNILPNTVYYYKVTKVSDSGIESDFSCPYRVSSSTIMTGFPYLTGDIGNVQVADINNNGQNDLIAVCSDGKIVGLNNDGSKLYTTPTFGFYDLPSNNYFKLPAIGDLDNDGIPDVAVGTSVTSGVNNIYAIKSNSTPLWTSSNLGNYPISSIVIDDINKDGYNEVITLTNSQQVFVLSNINGQPLTSWPKTIGTTGNIGGLSVVDLDYDGYKEIIACGTNGVYAWRFDGSDFFSSNPILSSGTNEMFINQPVIVDLNNDGNYEILLVKYTQVQYIGTGYDQYTYTGKIYALNTIDGLPITGWNGKDVETWMYTSTPSSVAVGDVNNDGFIEVFYIGKYRYHGMDHDGNYLTNFPITPVLTPGYLAYNMNGNSPILADIDENPNDVEILFRNWNGMNVYKNTGVLETKLNKSFLPGSVELSTIADLDNDGRNEIILPAQIDISSANKNIFVYKTFGSSNKIEWGSYRHDAQNTGVYKNQCQYSSIPYEIGTSFPPITTWNSNKTMNQNLVIKAGKTLIIKSTVKFQKDCKIIVEPGAKLILDGCRLTNSDCGNNMWQGIEVQGNKTLRQLPTNQGVVEIINGGIIENAFAAIRTLNSGDAHPLDFTGGIIRANGAIFKNNYSGIYIAPYHNHLSNGNLTNNISYIRNCTFETNSVLNDPTLNPTDFIVLNDVEGINITANTFKNTNPAPTALNEKGNGISIYNASCTIYGLCTSQMIPCNTYQPNTFQGLNYGISVSNYNSLKSVKITHNDFLNNYRGISIRNSYSSEITSNNFEIPDILTNNPLGSYGLYAEGCMGYKIEGNTFNSVISQTGQYGVAFKTLINNGSNNLYRNNFTNLSIGVISANNFPPTFSTKQQTPSINGLQIKCNEFIDITNKDIAITSGQIGSPQGLCTYVTSPANNMFSRTGTNPARDIFVNPSAGLFGYCYRPDVLTTPIDYTINKIIMAPCTALPTFNEANSCPSTLNNIINQSTNLSYIAGHNTQINTLVSLIDGGNTQTLLNKINSNLSAGQLKDDLLNAGPYLSDNVLIATVNRTNPVPPGILKDIIEPNSPLTTEVMNVVNSKNLPAGIMHDINSYQTGTSERAILEQQINELQAEKDNKVAELMQYYLNDTSAYKIDSVIIFLETQTDLQSKKQLVTAYLINGDCSLALNVLDSLPQLTEEDIVFKEFYSIIVDICAQDKTVYDLTPAQKQTLYSIVTTNTQTATAAKSVLTLVYGEYYPEIIEQLYDATVAGIKGNLYESFECGGSPVPDTKLYLFDQNNNKVTFVSPAITDNTGFFWFNNYYLSLLDSTALYSINTDGGYKIDNPEFKTIQDWFNSSPLTLNLGKSNKEWSDLYSSVDSLYNGGNAVDLEGNIYVAGYTGTLNSLSDFLTIKYSPTGQRLWVKTYNGTGNGDDRAIDIAVDNNNNCYVLGNSAGNGTGQDIVLVKYDSDGNQIWLNRYNDSQNNNNIPVALTIDPTGNIYATGYTKTISLTSNILSIKYSKTGTVTWVKTYNVNTDNIASDIKVDYSGNVIVAGSTGTSTNMNFITIKYNKNGSVIWSKLYDSGANENMKALTVDQLNNVYVTGAGTNVITIKYNSSGVQQWLANSGGTVNDITNDNNGNIYITGSNNTNGFTIKYNSSGAMLWYMSYTSIYTNGVDILQSVTLDKNNDVYVTGFSASAPYYTKYFEMVTIKYNTDGNEMWVEKLNGNSSLQAAGNDIVVSENLNVYVTGRIYDDYIFKMSTVKYSQCAESSMLKSMESQAENENQVISENINMNNKTPWILAMPNPINESSVISVNTASENDCVVEITDLFGRTVKSIKIKGSCKEVQIPRNELSVGIYNISLVQNGKKIAFSRMAVVE